MKNFVLLILGVFLGAIAMYFYTSGLKSHQVAETLQLVKPNGLISPSEAKTLNNAYDLRHRIISDSLFSTAKTTDNRSVWFDLEEVQSYIKYAENQSVELGYSMNGLRLYLGAYPEVKGQAGLTTLFFVPTGVKNTSKGAILFFSQGGGGIDIPGSDGLNKGSKGIPPGSGYGG